MGQSARGHSSAHCSHRAHPGRGRTFGTGFRAFEAQNALGSCCSPMETPVLHSESVNTMTVAPAQRRNFLFGAMSTLGSAGPAVSLLAVGANFVADGFPRPSVIGYAPMFALIVGRLLILPGCCIALWVALRHYAPFFPSDPLLMLVMCIECCTPGVQLGDRLHLEWCRC